MLRTPHKKENPEMDQAAVDLESVLGEVAKARTEALDWAQKIKDLSADFEHKKASQNEELAQIRAMATKETRKAAAAQIKANTALKLAQKNANKLESENKKLRKIRIELTNDINELRKTVAPLEKQIADLTKRKENLEYVFKRDQEALGEMHNQKTALVREVGVLTRQKADLEQKHSVLIATSDKHKAELEEIVSGKSGVVKEIKVLDQALTHKKDQLSTLAAQEVELQGKIEAQQKTIEEENVKINERLGHLALVEQRTQVILDRLTEAKKHFTAEQLARVGIKE